MEGGERLALLVGKDGLPDPHIAHYTLSSLRSSGNKASSIEKTLHALAVAQHWAEQRGIDLSDRARTFGFLSSGEILAFKDFVRRPHSLLNQPIGEEAASRRTISRNSAHFRYNVLVRYLEWLGQEYLARLGNTSNSGYLAARDRLDRFVARAAAS